MKLGVVLLGRVVVEGSLSEIGSSFVELTYRANRVSEIIALASVSRSGTPGPEVQPLYIIKATKQEENTHTHTETIHQLLSPEPSFRQVR